MFCFFLKKNTIKANKHVIQVCIASLLCSWNVIDCHVHLDTCLQTGSAAFLLVVLCSSVTGGLKGWRRRVSMNICSLHYLPLSQ